MPATTLLHDITWLTEHAKYAWTQNIIHDVYVGNPHTLYLSVY